MTLEAQAGEGVTRIATIAEAVAKQFGADAIGVAQRQAEQASGEVAERWYAVLNYLQAR